MGWGNEANTCDLGSFANGTLRAPRSAPAGLDTRLAGSITGVAPTGTTACVACLAGVLIALRADAGWLIALCLACVAGLLIALCLASVAGLLVALCLARVAGVSAGLLIALCRACVARVNASDASISRACVRLATVAGSTRSGAAIKTRLTGGLGLSILHRENRGGRTLRAKPNVEVEFIYRLSGARPNIMNGRVPREGYAGRLLACNRGLFGRHRRRMHHGRDQEFRIVIQLACQIKPLVTRPVALAGQSDQSHDFLRDLSWVWFHPIDKRMLR
jgi:hypothetical protein